MKITNKKILAVLLIAATLTGCDSLKNKMKGEDTKVEEPTSNEDAAKKEGEEDAEHYESTEKEGKEGEEPTEKEGEDSSEAETDPGMTAKERLEDAIFNNRVQARAAEILLEEVPESLSEETKAKLEKLVEDSNALIEKAEAALESL